MFGPGEDVPDPTEGIVNVNDLPAPTLVAYDRNHDHTPAPDAVTWPPATHPASVRSMIWAICLPDVQLISW